MILSLLSTTNQQVYCQKNIENQLSDSLTIIANSYTAVGKITIVGFSAKSNILTISASDKLSYIPFRPENVKRIYKAISSVLYKKYSTFTLVCQVENKKIEDLIPNFYKTENLDENRQFSNPIIELPLLLNSSRPFKIVNGLQNRHIALWQSHGWYFNQKRTRWEWQRPRVFTTVEDLFTQSFVLPYLAPMLENAGANVLIPRERDTQQNEVIVDNDSKDNNSRYREQSEWKKWITGKFNGFANPKKTYQHAENPFNLGTYREITSISNSEELSRAEWIPSIPEDGKYAVYVSYKTVENSTFDARYTVIHKGIKTEFKVNQTMNGGTWVYLGHFQFEKGRNNRNKVVLSNESKLDGNIITADAVKFGGGMGNIARNSFKNDSTLNFKSNDSINPNLAVTTKPPMYLEPEISNHPRYTEGARYWLQWAGMPDSIYSRTKWQNDYSDDFQSRGYWLNYLVGGSVVSPNTKGLNIPIDMALAFHSDAGFTTNDSIVGTLGICTVKNSIGNFTFSNGISRWTSRDLADLIQSQVVSDIRKTYAPEWTSRGIWNKSYSESRVPEVPTMLLELLSHQNFSDMRYGLDPRFKFTVSRAIYKGILKFLATCHKTNYVVQPLPVEQFSCNFIDKNKLRLHWKAVNDSLELSANPEKYVLYTRIDDGDFDNGIVINTAECIIPIQPGKIYSFKVKALNVGGESFPSEILSACKMPNSKADVLIVNGFTRLSAPSSFEIDSTYAGFLNDFDAGVPYVSDISYVGKQNDFKRNSIWKSDEQPGFGASNTNFETKVIAGNTFDYPFIHGKAIKSSGYSFVSCSLKAIVDGYVNLNQYKIVDLILGKQKQTFIGNAKRKAEFKTFPTELQLALSAYCQQGGNVFISGSYIGSDMCESVNSMQEDKTFTENLLKFKFQTSHASLCGTFRVNSSAFNSFRKKEYSFYNTANQDMYFVESPDAINPIVDNSYSICNYSENNRSAGIGYSGAYKVIILGFPFETIVGEKDRASFMESVLIFLNKQGLTK